MDASIDVTKGPLKSPQVRLVANSMRHDIIRMLEASGSGHPGGSLSAADMMSTLFFGGFWTTIAKTLTIILMTGFSSQKVMPRLCCTQPFISSAGLMMKIWGHCVSLEANSKVIRTIMHALD